MRARLRWHRGRGYRSRRVTPDGFVPQPYLPTARSYYNRANRGEQARIAAWLRECRCRAPPLSDAIPDAT